MVNVGMVVMLLVKLDSTLMDKGEMNMHRIIFTDDRALMEGRNDDQARLDEVARTIDIQSSVTARKYNYVISKEDLAQHLWLVYLEKLQDVDLPLMNTSLKNAAVDYARYEIRRGSSTTDYGTGAAQIAKSDKSAGKSVGATGSGTTAEFGGSVDDTESKRILSGDRFARLDAFSRVRLQEMLESVGDFYGENSREYLYMVGEMARQGMLEVIKRMIDPKVYREASKIGVSGRDTGAAAIAKLMGVGTGSGSYRTAVDNVVHLLKLKKYKV